MRKRTKSKSRLTDVIVALLCLLFALLFMLLFWKDLNSYTVKRDDKDRIATIEFKQKIAQRKFNDRVVWERVSQNAVLYNEDTIRTADLSQAIIHFDDGTTLDISENTMIQISRSKDGRLQIGVTGGDIQVASSATAAPVAVTLDDGSVVNVDAGSALAASSDAASGVRNIEVKSGSASVTTEKGEAALLTVGESVSIEESGLQKNVLTVLSPARDVKLLQRARGDAAVVDFAWTQTVAEGARAQSVVIQTSAAKDFSSIRDTFTVTSEERFQLPVTDDVLYWRIFASDASDKASSGKISLLAATPVEAISPLGDGEVGYRVSLPRITFRWAGNDYASRYRLLVSSTPDMRTPVAESETTSLFAAVDTLAEGSYYWQVTPFYALNGVGYDAVGASDVRAFSIVRNEQLRAPELSSPADGAELTYREDATATFIWKSELKDANYELLIARDEAFSDIAYSEQVSAQTRFVERFVATAAESSEPTATPDGRYWWKIIRHADDEDDLTPESSVRSFTLARYVPQANRLLYPPEDFSAESAKLRATSFTWKLSEDYAGLPALLQIARVSGNDAATAFSAPYLERRVENASRVDGMLLEEGRYLWRVGAVAEDGSVEGFTSPRGFIVLKELGEALITAPLAGSELLTYSGSPINVSWNSVSGADYYNVKVYALHTEQMTGRASRNASAAPATSEQLVAEKPAAIGTTASFVLPPSSERYIVRVQPVAAESDTSAMRTGGISSQEFSVRAPYPVQQLAPADGSGLLGLDALREPTVFSWQNGGDTAARYEFVLYKRQKDGALKRVEAITTQQQSVSLERLTEGTYRWQVRASTADGFPLDSVEREFIIRPVPELPRPPLFAPSQNLVMDAAYLRKHRSIAFSWKPVTGANSYAFALYKKNANGSLKAIYTEKNMRTTQVKLADLSLLDVGDFVWNVTAYCYAKDGYQEQVSPVATGAFKIYFELPKQVDSKLPGRMYGE